jgi:hypothetical protein
MDLLEFYRSQAGKGWIHASSAKRRAMKLIIPLCAIAVVLVAPMKAEEPTDVTLVQLVANADKFDGKLIRVIGFLRLEFEGNVLYLHREDYENALLGNGIWVDVTPTMEKQRTALNMNYVLLEGVFGSHDRGHMGMWSGAIRQIRRAEVWRPARRSPGTEKPPN